MMAERGLDRRDVLVGHTDSIREGAQDRLALLERGEGARAESFVVGLQLFKNVEARPRSGLLAQPVVEFLADGVQFLLDLTQTLLAFFDCSTTVLHVQLFRLYIGRK